MQTILFITDLMTGSRIPELAGVREVAGSREWHVEVVELVRLTIPLDDVIEYWKPLGAIIEGSGKKRPQGTAVQRLPVVNLDPGNATLSDPDAFTVTNDADAIADLAIHELVQTECDAFAFVGWSHAVGWSFRRETRFRKRLLALGKSCHVLSDPWTLGNKADFVSRLRPFLAGLPRPCGIFAANDDIAAVILDVCALDGIAVPGDFFLVGVDNNPDVCDQTVPTLSSIRPHFQRGGRLAAQLLAARVDDPRLAPVHRTYSPLGLTSRVSTRRVAGTSRTIHAALDLIRREACHGLKAEDVVKSMGLSERMAELRFKAATGRRITEEITAVRLEHVCELLRTPRQPLATIAHLCGWSSEVYLKRLFKARFGVTMRAWRASQQP